MRTAMNARAYRQVDALINAMKVAFRRTMRRDYTFGCISAAEEMREIPDERKVRFTVNGKRYRRVDAPSSSFHNRVNRDPVLRRSVVVSRNRSARSFVKYIRRYVDATMTCADRV